MTILLKLKGVLTLYTIFEKIFSLLKQRVSFGDK